MAFHPCGNCPASGYATIVTCADIRQKAVRPVPTQFLPFAVTTADAESCQSVADPIADIALGFRLRAGPTPPAGAFSTPPRLSTLKNSVHFPSHCSHGSTVRPSLHT